MRNVYVGEQRRKNYKNLKCVKVMSSDFKVRLKESFMKSLPYVEISKKISYD